MVYAINYIYRYSMELLLSYIEISQYQKYVIELSNEEININVDKYKQMVLPSNLPVSSILQKERKYGTESIKNEKTQSTAMNEQLESANIDNNLKLKGYSLYKKYIKIGSEFEINIIWQQREALMEVFDNHSVLLNNQTTMNHIFQLFEVCKEEMVTLMGYSLDRFMQKDEFQQLRLLFVK